jgi:hypothetical protein
MKRAFFLAGLALVGFTVSAWGAGLLHHCSGGHCIEPPAECPDCGCACDHGLHHCSAWRTSHAQKLIETLASGETSCERLKAAKKLGHRLHADYCCDPEVLAALIAALQNDPCWEVRSAAAWSIGMQGARTNEGVLALYLASRLDRHYLVRDSAADALDILLICRRECFKDLFARADVLVTELRRGGLYRPGSNELRIAMAGACTHATVIEMAPPVRGAAPMPLERIPAPMPPGKK